MKEKENISTGWVRLFRSLKTHWIWQDPVKLRWWLDILFEVNHADKTINVGYDVIDCKRGQTIKSLQTWSTEWKVSKDTVRNFFKLLEKEKMISLENIKISTRLTVCKYESYQCDLHGKQTASKRDTYTNNNDKNEKNNIEARSKEFYTSIIPHSNLYGKEMCREFYDYWTEPNTSKTKMRFEMQKTWDLSKRLQKWFKNQKEFKTKPNYTSVPNAIV